MSKTRSRPVPEPIKLEMKDLSRDIVSDYRHGKPNLAQTIERALVNAWKAGRDAAETGDADPIMMKDGPEDSVAASRLGRKTEAVLRTFGYVAYGPEGQRHRENHLCWRLHKHPFTGKKSWHLASNDGKGVMFEDLFGDASLQACVKLGLFAPGWLLDEDNNRLPDMVLVATAKTRPTFMKIFGR